MLSNVTLHCVSLIVSLLAAAPPAPQITKTIPTDGAEDVDPALAQVVVFFDTDMQIDSYSVLQSDDGRFPDLDQKQPFEYGDSRTFVIYVKLAPGTAYALRLNSAERQGFRSAEGTALPPTVIRFRTRGGEQKLEKGGWGAPDDSGGEEPAPKKADGGWGKPDDAVEQKPRTPKPEGGWGEVEETTEKPDRRRQPDQQPPAAVDTQIPSGWTMVDDKLFGTQVAVPPGWTPRVRGDVAFCVEPDELPLTGAFFISMLLKGQAQPEDVADGFDKMLGLSIPGLQTRTTGKPTSDSVQRDFSANVSGTAIIGSYRTVVSRSGTGFVMGYLAPSDHVERLRPHFYKILGSYRYTGPRMRMKPFKSAAIELKVPPGWQVATSEGRDGADQDIDWEVTCPQIPGAHAFMYSPKYFTSNWVSDMLTGQPDPTGLSLWQNRGCVMADFTSDDEALQTTLQSVLPGLQIVRQRSLDSVRDLFGQLLSIAVQTIQSTGGKLDIYVFELCGRRQVQGVEMRSVVWLAMSSMYVSGGIKGTCAIWNGHVRGFEAPSSQFAQVAPMLDRVASSFSYTMWWIREVQKANDHQAKVIRNFWKQSNRIDKDIFDNRMETQGAINEMMYDNLTENHGYLNKETGAIEKIPAEHLERFRREDGEIVSPEDVLERQIPVEQARLLREAWSDDYMSFDRRVQVWP